MIIREKSETRSKEVSLTVKSAEIHEVGLQYARCLMRVGVEKKSALQLHFFVLVWTLLGKAGVTSVQVLKVKDQGHRKLWLIYGIVNSVLHFSGHCINLYTYSQN